MADIGLKAQALPLAVKRIAELQRQITELVLAMTGERLREIVFAAEVKAFLGLDVICLSSSYRPTWDAKPLKGSQLVLRNTRASCRGVKALVAAEQQARQEILERMEIGARIDTRDVPRARKRLADATLTPAEAMTAASFEEKVAWFVRSQKSVFELLAKSLRLQSQSFASRQEFFSSNVTSPSATPGMIWLQLRSDTSIWPVSACRHSCLQILAQSMCRKSVVCE
ncbi:hypothetical protein [uncultured Agrobacterium sp.]|uniref:hypothetical protein n=1 Tax=uncultured Agrobacterium sp. TaxID=157277 RepID=UPI0025CE3380|nr:hypothetical protein [uncultured Agrobacterium sp.]